MISKPPLSFERAVVVGASGGIGAALAVALLDEGIVVHGLSRSGAIADPRLIGGWIDLDDEASIERAASNVGSQGAPDLVILATGLLHGEAIAPEKSYRQLSPAVLQNYFAVNAIGPALVAKYFLPLLPVAKPAVFAALSARVGSISDNRLGGWYGYRASKTALNMLVRTLSIELARNRPQGLCVALHPGTVDTALSKPFQRGVPAESLTPPAIAAQHLLQVIAALGPADSGDCFAWNGERIAP